MNIDISLKGEDFCLPALVRRYTDVESEELRADAVILWLRMTGLT